jgi:trehalose 6-phosphate phosphatase
MGIYWKDARPTILNQLVIMDRIGLVTDMDGTISHIVEDPEDAVVTPRNCELLQQLHKKLTLLSVVSGRSLRSVAERMQLPGVVYIGNHGLERCVDGQVKYRFNKERYRPRLESSVEELQKIQLDGVRVEDKGVTATIHYRQSDDPQTAYEFLLPLIQKIATQHGLEFFEGRMIFELRPPVKADKGSAFEELVHEFSLDGALYIGDDTTDIAALKMAQQLRQEQKCFAIGVGVMSNDNPDELLMEADLIAFGVPDVENLFAWILKNLN